MRNGASPRSGAPRVLFLGSTYAGHLSHTASLEAATRDDARIRPIYRRVRGWADDGLLERAPLLPRGLKGRARAALDSLAFARLPRPDVIWTSVREALLPHLWSAFGPLRRPLVLDLDWTLEQQEALAPLYYGRRRKQGLRDALARAQESLIWSRVTIFTPWSRWATDSLRRRGVPDERIRIIHPGVDLERWRPRPAERNGERPLRLLFVGGDFARKGGDLLLEVFRAGFAGRCELDIVTRDEIPPIAGVRVHRAEPDSAALDDLYARADLFVMPSFAECFGIATVEAMASGLPVLVGDGGGARDIVDQGETGWLIEPTPSALASALDAAVEARNLLPVMGRRARAVAEARFDARHQADAVIETILEARAIFAGRPEGRPLAQRT